MKQKIFKPILALVVTIILAAGMTSHLGNRAEAAPGTWSIYFNNNGISGVSNLPKTITTDPRYTVTIPSALPTRTDYVCVGYDTSTAEKNRKI